jgi:hypothetical protein
MADSSIPQGFQKGGNVSRSPLKSISNRAAELERLRQVLKVFPYEPMSFLNDTHRQFIREMAVHLGLDGENLVREIAIYIDGILHEEQPPYTAEKVLSVVSSKLKELEDDAEAERKRKNARTADNVSQPVAGTSKEAAEPQQEGGAAKEDAGNPPLEPSPGCYGRLQATFRHRSRSGKSCELG